MQNQYRVSENDNVICNKITTTLRDSAAKGLIQAEPSISKQMDKICNIQSITICLAA